MDVHLPRSGGRGQPVGTRICLLLAALAVLACVYLLVSPLERPTSQGPPFDCGTALSEPSGGFAGAVCGEINLRRQLQAGAVGLAAIVLAGGGLEIGSRLGNDGGTAAPQQAEVGPPGPRQGQEPPRPPGDEPATGPPEFKASQPFGDPDTSFVVYGRRWRPRTEVTLRLDGGTPVRLVTDRKGAFNWTVNQGGELFADGLPVGEHVVEATGGGQDLKASFSVGR